MDSPALRPDRFINPTPFSLRAALACFGCVILSSVVYLNALHNPFIYDDHRLILENRSIVDILNLRAILFHEITRPLVNLSYAIDRAVWGPEPFGFHLMSVMLHMLNVGLLFAVAWRLVDDRSRADEDTATVVRRAEIIATAAAILFAVHPMMTEAVGYISGRSELLSTAFLLAAFLALRAWMNTFTGGWLLLALLCWLGALASKETAVVFPLLCLYYDRVVREDAPTARRQHLIVWHVPVILLGVLVAALRTLVFLYVEHPEGIDAQWRFGLVEVDVICRYLALLLVPNGQTIFHAIPANVTLVSLTTVVALVSVTFLVGTIWLARRDGRIISFGLFWFLLCLLPSAALVVFDRGEPMAEHRVYLASCGFFLAVATAVYAWWERVRAGRPVGVLAFRVAAAMVVIGLGARTVIRNVIWSNPISVWEEAVEAAPSHWYPLLLLGESLHDAGRHAEAVEAFKRSAADPNADPSVYGRLGVCLVETGRLDEAASAFLTLRSMSPNSAEASNGLATVALVRGQTEAARKQFLATLTVDRSNVQARRGLAVIAETGRNPAEALKLCEEIQALAPDTPGNDDCIARNRAQLDSRGAQGKSMN